MNFLLRHLWAAFVVIVGVNHVLSVKRLRAATREDPVARAKGGQLLIGVSLLQLVPWIILGIGILSGSVASVFTAFSPRFDNPYIASVWVYAIASSALVSVWILFAGGATFVSKYGAGLSPEPVPVRHVRVLGVVFLGLAVAMWWWVLYMGPVSVPEAG